MACSLVDLGIPTGDRPQDQRAPIEGAAAELAARRGFFGRQETGDGWGPIPAHENTGFSHTIKPIFTRFARENPVFDGLLSPWVLLYGFCGDTCFKRVLHMGTAQLARPISWGFHGWSPAKACNGCISACGRASLWTSGRPTWASPFDSGFD